MKTLLFAAVLFAGLGCMNVHPVGPLAKSFAPPKSPLVQDGSTELTAAPAPRPTPPALLITPGEVTTENSASAVQKLGDEFKYDWQTLPPPSRTAEISVIKDGVKR